MTELVFDDAFHLGAAAVVAAPLLYAAVAKLLAPASFLAALPRYEMPLPPRPRTVIAIAVVEFAAGLSTLAVAHWLSALLSAVLYVSFALLLARALRAGARGDCGCFGALQSAMGFGAVARNTVFAVFAGALAVARAATLVAPYTLPPALAVAGLILVGGAALDTFVAVRRVRSA